MSLVDSLLDGACLRKDSLNLRLPQQIFKTKKQSEQHLEKGNRAEYLKTLEQNQKVYHSCNRNIRRRTRVGTEEITCEII